MKMTCVALRLKSRGDGLTDHLPVLGFTTGGGATAASIRLMPLSLSGAAVHLVEPTDCSDNLFLAVVATCVAEVVSNCTSPEVGSVVSSLPAALASLPAKGR